MSVREQDQRSTADSPALPRAAATLGTPWLCQPLGQGSENLIIAADKSANGELLRGLIHELSQPLGAIANYSAVCLHYSTNATGKGDIPAEVIQGVSRIAEQAQRANGIMRRLKCLIPGEDSQPSEVDVDDLVKEVVSMLGPSRRLHEVEVQLDMPGGLPRITADRVRLVHAVATVLKNVTDVVSQNRPDCRLIVIGTRHESKTAVEISFSYSGPETEGKDFDLVSSGSCATRPGRQGLGSPLSRSFAEALGVRLEAVSIPGSEPLFRIVMPIRSKELNVEE